MVRRTHDESADPDRPTDPDEVVGRSIPVGVQLAGAFSWRIIGVLLLVAVLVYLVVLLHVVVVPLLVAILVAGLLTPLKNRLSSRGVPNGLATAIVFLGLLLFVAGLVTLVVITIRSGFGDLEKQTVRAYEQLLETLKTSPLGISDRDVQEYLDSASKWLSANSSTILTGALSGASTIGDIGVGLVLSLFITLFLLIDGSGIWRWCVRLAPVKARAAVDGAGRAAWISVGSYARVQVLVAFIDAVGIGLVAFFLGLPLVIPIAVLVFLAAFIPFVGAILTGALAILVALVYAGPVAALVMLGGVIGVNQLEAHVLQPLLMGNAVRLHPIAVVLAVSSGSIVAGIGGAVFAVPLVAALNSAVVYIAGGAWKGAPPPAPHPLPQQPEGPDGERAKRRRRRRPKPEDVTTVG